VVESKNYRGYSFSDPEVTKPKQEASSSTSTGAKDAKDTKDPKAVSVPPIHCQNRVSDVHLQKKVKEPKLPLWKLYQYATK
jgi:hypothetical protein